MINKIIDMKKHFSYIGITAKEKPVPQSNATFQSTRHKKAQLSRHAQRRAQQRGISADLVPLISCYGDRTHDGEGGIRCLMTPGAMAKLIRAVGHSQRIDALAGTYIVISAEDESQVITVAHRLS